MSYINIYTPCVQLFFLCVAPKTFRRPGCCRSMCFGRWSCCWRCCFRCYWTENECVCFKCACVRCVCVCKRARILLFFYFRFCVRSLTQYSFSYTRIYMHTYSHSLFLFFLIFIARFVYIVFEYFRPTRVRLQSPMCQYNIQLTGINRIRVLIKKKKTKFVGVVVVGAAVVVARNIEYVPTNI